MTAATALAALGIAVGIAGIIVPVLPGLILVLVSVAGWAFAVRDPLAWGVLGAAVVIALVGWSLQYLLPGRRLKDAGIPTSTLIVGAVGAVVGLTVPVVGLPLGFVAGVVLAELVRQGTFAAAWPSARRALVAAAMSFGIELAAGTLIALVWGVGAYHVLV